MLTLALRFCMNTIVMMRRGRQVLQLKCKRLVAGDLLVETLSQIAILLFQSKDLLHQETLVLCSGCEGFGERTV